MPEMNIKQAMLIPSARAVDNPIGTAPGWWVEHAGANVACQGKGRKHRAVPLTGPVEALLQAKDVIAARHQPFDLRGRKPVGQADVD